MSSPSGPSHHHWLHDELESWVREGIIAPEAAEKLRLRHPKEAAHHARARSSHWIMVLFGIIGAVLVGGGIILLLAHNWEQMGRPARLTVAFLPLVLSQALAFWMLWTDRGGTWGREAVGTFTALMTGACIALVSQTYHLGGDFVQFMLVWTLLSLPIAYLMRATLPAIWYCVAAIIWTAEVDWGNRGDELWFWPLLALLVPLWWMELRRGRYHPRAVLLAWAIAGAGCIGLALTCDFSWSRNYVVLASGGWYALLYLAGRRWFAEGRTIWHRPFQFIGTIGVAVVSLMLTFDWAWRESWRGTGNIEPWSQWMAVGAAGIWALLALALWIESIVRRDIRAMVVGALPALILLVMFLQVISLAVSQAIFNVYVFATGLALLVAGVRAQQIGTVNGGMAIISALVLCRFFDTDMSFVLRGVVFILLGVAFIVTNFILIRRKGATA